MQLTYLQINQAVYWLQRLLQSGKILIKEEILPLPYSLQSKINILLSKFDPENKIIIETVKKIKEDVSITNKTAAEVEFLKTNATVQIDKLKSNDLKNILCEDIRLVDFLIETEKENA